MTRRRPGATPFLVSLAVHLVILVPMVAFTRLPTPIEFETIRINLVMAPEPAPAPAVVEQPAPRPEPVATQPAPRVEERRPDPPPQRQPEQRTERRPDPPEPTRPQPTPPAEEPTRGGDAVNIQTEGREFPYPEYLANVIEQVYRYFRWTDDSQPRATIYFEILSDGTTRNIRIIRPSGNLRFDFALEGAVETAGNRGAFGPLPQGFAAGSLPIQLEVEPPR